MFFGRGVEIEQLLEQLRSSRRRYTGRLLAVIGPSGSGKSSLVRAGLIPRLRRAQQPWVVLTVSRPADRPMQQLAYELADAFRAAGVPRSPHAIELELANGWRGLLKVAEELSPLQVGDRAPFVLVFVDQAEERVTATGRKGQAQEQARFLALLHGATRGEGPVWSLITLRSEFLSAFLQAERGRFAFDDHLALRPLDVGRLAEIIERPADRAGLRFAPGLVGRMVADTEGGDALPLLAHTLAALHDRSRARPGATITIGDYDNLGGVVGALRRTADEERRRLTEQGLADLVIPTLSRLVRFGPEGQIARCRLARATFRGQQNAVVDAFVDARLLTSTELDGESVIEVAHEALLRQWPPLAESIERDREALQARSDTERAAEAWQRGGRQVEDLLPRERLAAAVRLRDSAERTAVDLSDTAQAFVVASELQQRCQDAIRRRRIRRTLAGVAAAFSLISAFAIVALIQRGRATDQRDTAQATLLATNALNELEADPSTSLVFGLRAYAAKPTSFAEGALRIAASQAIPQLVLGGSKTATDRVLFAPDGRHLAAAGADGTLRVWDLRTPRTPPTILRSIESSVSQLAFSEDGRYLASAVGFFAPVWDRRSRRTRATVLPVRVPGPVPVPAVIAVDFAHDGHHLVAVGEDGDVRMWDMRTPRTPPTIVHGRQRHMRAVVFAPDGRHLAGVDGDGTLRVWDWKSPRTPTTILPGGSPNDEALAFAPDGHHIASGGANGTVRVVDWRSPRTPATTLRGQHRTVATVVFAPDGRHLASAGDDAVVRVQDWRAPSAASATLRGHRQAVRTLAFTPDGRRLASGGDDRTVRVWDWRAATTRPATLHGPRGRLNAVGFARDGRHLVGASIDGPLLAWDWTAPRKPVDVLRRHLTPSVLPGGTKLTHFVAVGFGDGSHVARGEDDGDLRVFDWLDPRSPPAILRRSPGPINAVAFAGDGRHLATAAGDGAVRVWDWRAPKAPPTALPGPRRFPYAVAVDRDGRHVASGDENGLSVWDWRKPEVPRTILPDALGIGDSLAFAGDGRHLASGGDDGAIRVWDWRSPRAAPTILIGHKGGIAAVAFSPDQRHLASAGSDRTVRIWDWREPRIPPTILRGQGDVNGLAFSTDGRHLATAGSNGSAYVWDCERCRKLGDLLRLARTRVPVVVPESTG